ncbi:MAG: GNAT family N-acetyltransferase [Actinomycetes bacterium]
MQIHFVPRPASRDAAPHPLVVGVNAAERAIETADFGHADFVDPARARSVRLFGADDGIGLLWAATHDGVGPDACAPDDVLGLASVSLPLKEDLDSAYVYIAVRPDARGRGIARSLLDAVTPELRARGRTTWMSFALIPGTFATGPDALPAKSGTGAVDPTLPAHRWLLAEGFELEQCERTSTLPLDDRDAVLARADALRAKAEAAAGHDYESVGWVGATPNEFQEGVAWLESRMSTDAPAAGLAFDEQHWDLDRLATFEERRQVAGIQWVSAGVRHRPTGELVALTRLEWPAENPAGVWQETTLVRSDHRGHRLGLLIKAANLPRLLAANPDAARVHTWNASENSYMLAINDALGYVPTGIEGAWQKKF